MKPRRRRIIRDKSPEETKAIIGVKENNWKLLKETPQINNSFKEAKMEEARTKGQTLAVRPVNLNLERTESGRTDIRILTDSPK